MTEQQSDIYAWFAVLEGARNTSDFNLAAKAKHELAKLGVDVRYRQPTTRRNGAREEASIQASQRGQPCSQLPRK